MKHLVPGLLLGLLLTVLGLMGFQGASTPFFLDDVDEMQYIHGLDGPGDCWAGDCYGLFRPIKNLIFYVVSRYLAESALAGHLLSFALYLVTTAIVFWWFKRWFGQPLWALIAVAVWALAPTQMNHLLWLSSANILVAISGVVGGLCAYELFRDCWTQGRRRVAGLWALTCLLAYWVALLAYEGAIMLPGLVLLLDGVRRRGAGHRHHYVMYAALVASAVGFVCLRWSMVPPPLDNPAIVTPSRVHLSLVSAYFSAAHLWTWLAPFGRQEILGTFVWGQTASGLVLVSSWVLLLVLVGLGLGMRKHWPDLTLGSGWFLIAFCPMSNLIPFENGPFGDFYIPLPSIGLVLVLVAVLRRCVYAWLVTRPGSGRRLAYAGVLTVLLGWRGIAGLEAFQWIETWQHPEQLYRQSMHLRPHSFRARANLAPLLMRKGQYGEAEALARQCVDQAPWTAMHFGLLADIQRARGNVQGARDNYVKVIELCPADKHARFALAQISEHELGDSVTAMAEYVWLLQADWHCYSTQAAIHLARLYEAQGQPQQTIQVLEEALAKCPPAGPAQERLSAMLAQTVVANRG